MVDGTSFLHIRRGGATINYIGRVKVYFSRKIELDDEIDGLFCSCLTNTCAFIATLMAQ